MSAELTIFGRFRVRAGCEEEMIAALAAVAGPTRAEPGCLAFQSYRSVRDTRLFFVNSRWTDEPAFDRHAALAHTLNFIARAEALAAEAPEVTRARPVEGA